MTETRYRDSRNYLFIHMSRERSGEPDPAHYSDRMAAPSRVFCILHESVSDFGIFTRCLGGAYTLFLTCIPLPTLPCSSSNSLCVQAQMNYLSATAPSSTPCSARPVSPRVPVRPLVLPASSVPIALHRS